MKEEKYICYQEIKDDWVRIDCTKVKKCYMINYLHFMLFLILTLFMFFIFPILNRYCVCLCSKKKQYKTKNVQCNIDSVQCIIIHPDESIDISM